MGAANRHNHLRAQPRCRRLGLLRCRCSSRLCRPWRSNSCCCSFWRCARGGSGCTLRTICGCLLPFRSGRRHTRLLRRLLMPPNLLLHGLLATLLLLLLLRCWLLAAAVSTLAALPTLLLLLLLRCRLLGLQPQRCFRALGHNLHSGRKCWRRAQFIH